MPRNRNGAGGGANVSAIDERELAVALVKRGLRIVALENILTRLTRSELSRLWKEIHPERSAPAGCLPSGAASLIKTPRESMMASALLVGYCAHASNGRQVIDPEALLASWDELVALLGSSNICNLRFAASPGFCNINTAWVIARDYRAGIVHLDRCANCGASRIFCDNWSRHSRLHRCPFCENRASHYGRAKTRMK